MPEVVIYSTKVCPFCDRAKKLLQEKGVEYTEYYIDEDQAKREEMLSRSQRRTVPQIFIGDEHVGGFDDLHAISQSGELDALLAN